MKRLLSNTIFLIILTGLCIVVYYLDLMAWIIRKPRKGIPVGEPELNVIEREFNPDDFNEWYGYIQTQLN